MADTIITNTPDSRESVVGSVLMAIILAILIIGAIFLYQTGTFNQIPKPAESDTTEVNVTIPTPTSKTAPKPTE